MTTKALEGRIALVTGASRGIGRAIAKRYCAEGATVIAVGRTQGALEELDDEVRAEGGTLVLVPADLRDEKTIEHMATSIYQRYGKLDILIGNAAVLGALSPLAHTKPKDWDDVLKTNLTVNWQLIRYFEPLLKLSDAGRAVFVTSSVGHNPRAYWGAYAVSKAALEMTARIWADETEKTNIKVNLYDPGRTRTRMRACAFPGEDESSLPPPESHGDTLVHLASPTCTAHGEMFEAGSL